MIRFLSFLDSLTRCSTPLCDFYDRRSVDSMLAGRGPMSAFIMQCPCPCGVRFPVDSETMRVEKSVGNAVVTVRTEGNVVYIDGEPYTVVSHLGRPDPAGDSDWPDPGDAA